ncbi:MAG: hypothetical protein ABSG35_10875 [Syntrophobacteraceae bacterium]
MSAEMVPTFLTSTPVCLLAVRRKYRKSQTAFPILLWWVDFSSITSLFQTGDHQFFLTLVLSMYSVFKYLFLFLRQFSLQPARENMEKPF